MKFMRFFFNCDRKNLTETTENMEKDKRHKEKYDIINYIGILDHSLKFSEIAVCVLIRRC